MHPYRSKGEKEKGKEGGKARAKPLSLTRGRKGERKERRESESTSADVGKVRLARREEWGERVMEKVPSALEHRCWCLMCRRRERGEDRKSEAEESEEITGGRKILS